jgi:hypothetical protein
MSSRMFRRNFWSRKFWGAPWSREVTRRIRCGAPPPKFTSQYRCIEFSGKPVVGSEPGGLDGREAHRQDGATTRVVILGAAAAALGPSDGDAGPAQRQTRTATKAPTRKANPT